jgi:hypothetical protein
VKLSSFLLSSSLFLLLAALPFLGIVPISHADSPNVKYGTFYYVWDDGYGDTSHFNGTPPNYTGLPSTWWTVVDQPLLGFYFSNDTRIIKAQIALMHEAGIDFVLVSWWGWSDESDNNTKIVFDTMKDILPIYNMQIAISVEPINESGVYNFAAIKDYIYQNFVAAYPSVYMKLDGKPLLTWMQGGTMTNPEANRVKIKEGDNFTSRIIGDTSYVDWYWWFPNNGSPNQTTPLLSNVDGGQTTIEPRYDDSRLGNGRNTKNDADYSEGENQKQWDAAKAWIEAGKCKIVLIGTWNDYTERTQIEPCFDATSFTPYPFYLLDITRANIQAPNPAIWYQDPFAIVTIILAVVLGGAILVWWERR